MAIESLRLLADKEIFVDQVILRGSLVHEWTLENVGRVDYITAQIPYLDIYYSVDINPFDSISVQEHRVAGLYSHTPRTNEQRERISNLIVDLIE